MKLKYRFENVEMDDEIVCVPVGNGANSVQGVLKTNHEGKEVLDLLQEETTEEAVVNALHTKYSNELDDICLQIIEYNEEECFHWDYSDDCYLVYSLGEGDTHFHPESPKVFRPTKPVPKALREKLKAKYEEMLRLYGANS